MKRLSSSSGSFHALLPISSSVEENALLLIEEEEEEEGEEHEDLDAGVNGSVSSGQLGEKKRWLSADQVKALEKNFEAENKLDPERKAQLAQDLSLQPCQVAIVGEEKELSSKK